MNATMNATLVERAREFARRRHADQLRKYTAEPYFVHLEDVARIVGDLGLPEEIVAAAYLHDVLEDTATTRAELEEQFGPRVADLVEQVTDVSQPADGNRAKRKALDCAHLAEAEADAQSIKLADVISNSANIAERDPGFAKVYLREKDALLDVLTKGHPALIARAKAQVRGAV
jgi:(p)ppGpp synthase/HD superfamily hydrolase